ncbi:uncharacterized protein LY89DRAFT_598097 [Mollisia scopiformis]|uniref:Fe2OG dioxygenase domain-containing protein n=1 Tax=Mollisia scopiformis TaxID=149040 RepID=A0A132BAA2_MOLSC|nr:uncharacterized protein LY89DRAFT_598097 [Mollisia scopiformis]KUJ09311.1 hypothetical protein LY89DRAFT_598097 [Mollisia scopiformis]
MDIEPEKFTSPKKSRKKAVKVRKAAYYNNSTESKPDPHDMPQVWANKRQQLCETLPAYRAYQSGAYTSEGILYGFLVDAEVGTLDKFDDQIIITTIGGDRSKDDSGNTVQNVSKDNKASALAAERTMRDGGAVLVIAGQGNRLSPSKLPHYYNVLGWFKVTDVWRETDKKIWKIRLEKIDLTERSWWAAYGTYPAGTDPLAVDYESPKATIQVCGACHYSSKQLYEQGWVCLQSHCQQFFKFSDATVETSSLQYSDAFLRERTKFTGPDPGPLSPPLPTQADLDGSGNTPYEKIFRAGIICPECGCCSRRVQWHQWECENDACSFVHHLKPRVIRVEEALAMAKPQELREYCHDDIPNRAFPAGRYDVHEYVLPGSNNTVAGWIRLFKTCNVINEQQDGPDDLFKQLQDGSFKLKRNAVRCPGAPSEILTSHFASNWGAIYKYGVTPTTTGFSEAAPVILKALKRLTWAGEHALGEEMQEFREFNELLLLGYYEDGQIDYHDDGEKTLGPTVATLSLGADAMMKFRPKKKSTIGVSKGAKGNKADYLKIVLKHGDLLIMHGNGIHKDYEHSVKPAGKLRFALTSRFVIPELMPTEADAEFARIGGILPAGHEQYNYDGDVHAQLLHRPEDNAEPFGNMAVFMARRGQITTDEAEKIDNAVKDILGRRQV